MTQAQAMLLSMAVEALLAFAVVRWRRWPCKGPASAALSCIIATAVTHPHLWTTSLGLYPSIGYAPTVALTETVVVIVEAGIIFWGSGLRLEKALLLSVLTNSATTVIGILMAVSEIVG